MRTVPIRSFQDFLGSSARFGVPTDATWRNRLLANLVYFQSNYFLIAIIIFALMSFQNPTSILLGLGFTCVPLLLFMLSDVSPQTVRNPKVAVPSIISLALLLFYFIGHLIYFLLVVLLPCLIVLLHALLRQRSIKSKLTKLIDSTRPTDSKTPMGYLLEVFGADAKLLQIDFE